MKLLILDDDVQIREGIQYGIDWKNLGFEEVRSAGDGLAGLKIAREMTPDIVLSDVRMPGMDGMEFLIQAKLLFPGIKVILISGYDDFEYLKKAIQYNADDYELKPIKVKDLIKRIGELRQKIEEERVEEERRESYRVVYEDTFLTRILDGTGNQEETITFLKEKLKPYGRGTASFFCAVIEADPPPPPQVLASEEISLIGKNLCEFQKRNFLFSLNPCRFLLISGLESSKTQARSRQEELMKQLGSLNRQLAACHLSVSASISAMYPLPSMKDAYTQAMNMLEWRGILGRGTILCADALPKEKSGESPNETGQDINAIFKAVINQNETELRDTLEIFRKKIRNEDNSFNRIKELMLHLAEKINHYLLDMNMDENCFDIMELQKDMGNFVFLEDLMPWWETLLLKTMHPIKKVKVHAGSPRIARAIDYIQAHLFEDISAEMVAGIINITPNYFSAQFKKETGFSFKTYINRERLSAAVYLLDHTDEPVYMVAEKTGYHDYIYFSQVFKQAYGSSPSEYRSRFQEEKTAK